MEKTVYPGALHGTLPILPSKSASHRAVLMAALCAEETRLAPLQLSRDIEATLNCARALGYLRAATLTPHDVPGFVRAHITGGARPADRALRTLDCGESGSTLRFLIPLALDGCGPVRLIGHGRLMQRPLDVYAQLFIPRGMRWTMEENALLIEGQLTSGEYALRGDVSSQFLTGLLLALPQQHGESVLTLTTPLESGAYVALTRRVQVMFGIQSHWDGNRLVIPGDQTPHSPGALHVEGDWSHAAFYLVAGCIGDGAPVTLTGLDPDSAQADRAIVPLLRAMGAHIDVTPDAVTAYPSTLHAATADAAQCPDLVPALAVAMAAAPGESRITGAARLRIKESDRLAAMRAALCACGCDAHETPDGLVVRGGQPLHGAHIDGCNDHRIVMAMAVAATRADAPLTITDAEATAKSAPAFWQEWASLGGQAQ